MKIEHIEHIVYITSEEYEDLIKKSGSKNKIELNRESLFCLTLILNFSIQSPNQLYHKINLTAS